MPSKNKPKRLDRQRSKRVARRKRRIADRAEGTSRTRAPRPKNKTNNSLLKALDSGKSEVKKSTEKKTTKKVAKKSEDATKDAASSDEK